MTREVSTRIPAVRPSERLDSTVPPLTSLVRTPLVVRIRIIIPAIIVVLWDRRALDDVGQWTFDSIHRSRDWLRGPTDQNNLGFNNWDSIGNLTRLGWVGQDRAGPSKVYFLFIFQTGAGILKHPLTPPASGFRSRRHQPLFPPAPHPPLFHPPPPTSRLPLGGSAGLGCPWVQTCFPDWFLFFLSLSKVNPFSSLFLPRTHPPPSQDSNTHRQRLSRKIRNSSEVCIHTGTVCTRSTCRVLFEGEVST